MAVSSIKTWTLGEVLSASDLNAGFNNILNNGTAVAFPLTAAVSFGGFATTSVGDMTFSSGKTLTLPGPLVMSSGTMGLTSTPATFTSSDLVMVTSRWLGAKSTTIASASTTDLSTATGNHAHISGTATINAFGTVQAGTLMVLTFDGILSMVHSSAIINPTGATIVTAANDTAVVMSEGTNIWRVISYSRASGLGLGTTGQMATCNFRLTLTAGNPAYTGDVTAATTIYMSPFGGNEIALYNGSSWAVHTTAELGLAIPATTATVYDVFCYSNSGIPAIEALAWTNDSTRATALTLQNGVLVKTGVTTRRYIGSFRTTAVSGQTEDSLTKRYVYSYYNRITKPVKKVDTTDSWVYSTATFRQANTGASNFIEILMGVVEDTVDLSVVGACQNDTANVPVAVGLGINSSTVNSAHIGAGCAAATAGVITPVVAHYKGYPTLGYAYYAWLEKATASGTTTWYGDNGSTFIQTGLTGTYLG